MAISPAELRDYFTYQVGAVTAFVSAAGGALTRVKPLRGAVRHGLVHPEMASAMAISECDPSLSVCLLRCEYADAVEARCRPGH